MGDPASAENAVLSAENAALRAEIAALRDELKRRERSCHPTHVCTGDPFLRLDPLECTKLSNDEIRRYSRQLIMSEIGPERQRLLRSKSVLIVGAGGLCSTSAMYLSGAGIGRIGVVDFDRVEISNLQRQIIHKESDEGELKSISASRSIREFNSDTRVVAYPVMLMPENALEIIRPYDLVLDCTDNVSSRYLINDACVMLDKPLVSGSALRMEGHVTVYHYGEMGPCYRCLFPDPPPRDAQGNCNNEGVLGVVPGIIGCIQALEAIKVLICGQTLSGRMLYLDANTSVFREFKLRARNSNCSVCGDRPRITKLFNYESCSPSPILPGNASIVPDSQKITARDYFFQVLEKKQKHLLLDVRPSVQFNICSLPQSVNAPLSELDDVIQRLDPPVVPSSPIYVICRRGKDSQLAVKKLVDLGFYNAKSIIGGVSAWSREVDSDFPTY
ncbi:sulfur carrier protein adenylyltransferase-like isoform X1 [Schistocerca gregaria]|uniref:sulfur carrier protein adenylyltransferase-like isoform X1 n=2 Tax=Schistocerca gregaria TaxID=7010 RepID=UPI00211EE0E0|nr:sulfur carrier protein adenylyltransferase-like isoform X1 [Schistocerca gregaria]